MRHMIEVVIEFAVVLLAADFASGLVHWVQDRFPQSRRSLLSQIVILYAAEHHRQPDKLRQYTWWERNRAAGLLGAAIAVLWAMHVVPWELAAFSVLLLFSGQSHYWAHRARHENGLAVRLLQRAGLLISKEHHARHHATGGENYCVITPWVNPLLNRLGFFEYLDRATGAHHA